MSEWEFKPGDLVKMKIESIDCDASKFVVLKFIGEDKVRCLDFRNIEHTFYCLAIEPYKFNK